MKYKYNIFFVAIAEGIVAPAPTINSATTTMGVSMTKLLGSLNGGTVIHIECDNVDPDPVKNLVTVGPYTCPIVDNGINDRYLSCITPAPTD